MKIRNGFVSNSSSSSFIVSGNKEEDFIINVPIDLRKFGRVFTKENIKDFLEYANKEIYMEEDSLVKAIEKLANGKIILAANVSNDSEDDESRYLYYAQIYDLIPSEDLIYEY